MAGETYLYRYNGKELNEELGLYDYGARWYDPAVARWTSIDPLADSYAPFSPYNYVLGNPISLVDPDGRTVKPAGSLTGKAKKIFRSLRRNNQTYNNLLSRYDTHPGTKDGLHFVVGVSGRISPADKSYGHTYVLQETSLVANSKKRGYRALYNGTVESNLVGPNIPNASEIGIAATLIHEAVHGNILAELPFELVNSQDHHVPLSFQLFEDTVAGLTEFVSDNNLEYSAEDIKLLSALPLLGTSAVDEAFGLDNESSDYEQRINDLRARAKALFFSEQD